MRMTVKQLREKLSEMPQDAEVIYYDGDNGVTYINEVEYETSIIMYPHMRNPQREDANVVVLGE
jgi:hypothetical protein